ncbi:MAG: hypothetical protein IJG38_00015 [Thermoguttaceae bacterium]|nr:hypothetical protein [Thermoguttaceae bacterium]
MFFLAISRIFFNQNPSAASRANQNAAADGSPGLVPAADERTLERLPERLMVPWSESASWSESIRIHQRLPERIRTPPPMVRRVWFPPPMNGRWNGFQNV